MSFLKNFIRDYFTYTRSEKQGIFVMLGLLIIGLLILFAMNFMEVKRPLDYASFSAEVDSFYAALKRDSIANSKKPFVSNYKTDSTHTPITSPPSLFYFDPNNLPDSLWIKLGISEKQTASIKKYEAAGGKFFSKADVKKMYVISDEMYSRIEPFIRIEKPNDSLTSDKKYKTIFPSKDSVKTDYAKLFPLDLNTSSTIELEKLPAIGPAKANAIFNYKIRLGGYVNIDQLQEVYGMTDSVFDLIKEKVFINHDHKPIQININTDNKQSLNHPYISFKLADMIMNNRKAKGNYKNVEEIKTLPIVKEALFQKLLPYIKAE
jgi:competence protein ComEA